MPPAIMSLASILLILGATASAQDLKPGDVVDVDPSTVAIKDVLGEKQWAERFRFRADFNFDGIPDLAISCDRRMFGNAGGPFEIYLGTDNGKWKYIGDIGAHPLAVHLAKRDDEEGIVSFYWRHGADEGSLCHCRITSDEIVTLEGKTIHPGDGGTDEGRAEYEKYFSDKARLRPEVSSTNSDGKVTWKPYKPS